MSVELYEKDTPITVANFVKLAKDGFYDGLKWHRVIPDFVIQGSEDERASLRGEYEIRLVGDSYSKLHQTSARDAWCRWAPK